MCATTSAFAALTVSTSWSRKPGGGRRGPPGGGVEPDGGEPGGGEPGGGEPAPGGNPPAPDPLEAGGCGSDRGWESVGSSSGGLPFWIGLGWAR
jgi:hypothetical protein